MTFPQFRSFISQGLEFRTPETRRVGATLGTHTAQSGTSICLLGSCLSPFHTQPLGSGCCFAKRPDSVSPLPSSATRQPRALRRSDAGFLFSCWAFQSDFLQRCQPQQQAGPPNLACIPAVPGESRPFGPAPRVSVSLPGLGPCVIGPLLPPNRCAPAPSPCV